MQSSHRNRNRPLHSLLTWKLWSNAHRNQKRSLQGFQLKLSVQIPQEQEMLLLNLSFLLTGPTGKILLMPEDPNAVFIMVATGTGIAPYRAFWRRQFMEDVPNYKFSGLSWLFMGVANSDAKLYDDELQQILKQSPDQ